MRSLQPPVASGAAPVAKNPSAVPDDALALWECGRVAWPTLSVSAEDFFQHLVRVRQSESPPRSFATLSSDLYLACACLLGQAPALALLEERVLSQVPQFLLRHRPDEATLSEVQQAVRERLLLGTAGQQPKLAEYSGLGPLAAFVRVVAVRIALNLYKQRGRQPIAVPDIELSAIGPGPDPELHYLQSQHRETFRHALNDALASLSCEQRNLLRLHLLDGLNIDQLGALFQVHRATAARRLKAAREQVLQEAKRKLLERLRLTPSELDSLLRVLYSHLDVSLTQLLNA